MEGDAQQELSRDFSHTLFPLSFLAVCLLLSYVLQLAIRVQSTSRTYDRRFYADKKDICVHQHLGMRMRYHVAGAAVWDRRLGGQSRTHDATGPKQLL